jgi:6-methylsalicylate decarboxylase
MKVPDWSPQRSLDFMKRNGIGTAILSLSAPALTLVNDTKEAATLCRRINECAASLVKQHPFQFGFFATIPSIDDTSACLNEIEYGLRTLGADGVTLMTSYGGRYLGHPDCIPLWEELDRRSAVVFIHPTLDILSGALTQPTIPRPVIDFPHETTRTAVHMIIANVVRRFPNCKIILSHGGGTLPYIATRVAHQSADVGYCDKSADEFLEDARTFYYDLALTDYDVPVDALLQFVGPERILYGSDFPFAREKTSSTQVAYLDQSQIEKSADQLIQRNAALPLFPRFTHGAKVTQ